VHSFTPVFYGVERQAEIGLLYDPRRSNERLFCAEWRNLLQRSSSNNLFRVRMNYPYKGTADGFITSLRKIFSNSYYIGIELEVNQGVLASAKARQPVTAALVQSLNALIRGT
jgi:predicted N-formylglutamate amidohydrolase